MKELCFIDTETTGILFGFHEIIDIAIIRTSSDGKKMLGEWQQRFQPKFPERITEDAKKWNNYSPDNWNNSKPQSSEIWKEIIKFWDNCIPICHNPSFDRAFITVAILSHQIKQIGLDYHWIGTESMAWLLYQKGIISGLSLNSLAEHFHLDPEPSPHTAINGTSKCREVYLKLMR